MENITRFSKKLKIKPDVVEHTCNPNTQEAEAGGSRVQGQIRLHSLVSKQKRKKEKWVRERERERN
jgi:hypothetical protein